jgi:hypothetical protein
MEAHRGGQPAAAERAVFVHARRDEGMGELQEDRARPSEEHEPLGVDPARDRVDYRSLAATR